MGTMRKRGHAAGDAVDAISLLKADHREARELLSALSESSERAVHARETKLAKVAPALWVHMQIEEEIFYPAFLEARKKNDDDVAYHEAKAEHAGAKAALAKLEREDPSTTRFRALAKVVNDLIDHHATEEEEEMFPRAKALLGEARLRELGLALAHRKEELLANGRFLRGPAEEAAETATFDQGRADAHESKSSGVTYRNRDEDGSIREGRGRYATEGEPGWSWAGDRAGGRYEGERPRGNIEKRDERARFSEGDDERGHTRGGSVSRS